MGKGVKAGEAFVELLANTTKFEKGLKRAQDQMKAFGAGVQSIGLKIAAAGVAMTAPFIIASKVFAKMGDDLEKMARRTGLSIEALSGLGFAAEQSGASLAVLEKGIKTMQRSIVDLSRDLSTQKDAFEAIGLVFDDIKNLSPEDQFKLIAERLSKITDPTKKAATALMLFGRAGAQLLPLMEDGAKGIEKLQKEAEDLGIIVSEDQAKAAAKFTDDMNRLFRVIQKGIFEIGQSVAPVISKIIDKILGVIKPMMDWIKENRALIAIAFKTALAITAIGTAIALVGTLIIGAAAVIGILASAIGAVISIVSGLAAALLFIVSPIGIMIAAISVGAVFIVKKFGLIEKAANLLKDLFNRLKSTFGDAITAIVESLKSGNIEGAFSVLMSSVKLVVAKGLDILTKAWVGFKLSVIDAAGSAFESVLLKANELVGKMKLAFFNLAKGLEKAFVKIRNSFLDIWDEVVGALAKAITTDERVRRVIDEQTTDSIEGRKKDRLKALSEIDKKTRDDVKKETALNEDLIKGFIKDIVTGVKSDAVKDFKAAETKVIESQESLKETIDKTRDSNEDIESEGQSVFDDITNALNKLASPEIDLATDPTKLITQGGFNPFGLDRQTQDFQNQMLKATKDNEKNTKKLASNQGKGAVFA